MGSMQAKLVNQRWACFGQMVVSIFCRVALMVDLAGLRWTWVKFWWRHLQFRESVKPVETRLEPAQDWFGPEDGGACESQSARSRAFCSCPIVGTHVFAIEVSL